MKLLFLVVALLSSVPASAAVYLSAVGSLSENATQYTDASGNTTDGKLGFGAGMLAGIHLLRSTSFETGALYLVSNFTLQSGASSAPETLSSVYIPAVLRFHFSRTFSISGGAYYNAYLKAGVAGDYGFEGGARLSFDRWFVDARYSQGERDYGGGLRYSNVLGLVGFRLGAI
jgi:hypothetical protein